MLDSLFLALGLNQTPATFPPPVNPAPLLVFEPGNLQPIIAATAAIVIDLNSGQTLFAKNSDEPLPIASLTKLMTALVVREKFALSEVVQVSAKAAHTPPAKIWLRPGEKISVQALLRALLIRSANDAAFALAEKLGFDEFITTMNQKGTQLGLKNSHFSNPAGFDDPENFSTARELALIAQVFWRDNFLREIVGNDQGTVFSIDQKIEHDFGSTNRLFNSFLNIQGLKTGFTEAAGECFAGVNRLPNGHEILAIVLNSPNRFQEVKALLSFFTPLPKS